jgi:hypothetical protein
MPKQASKRNLIYRGIKFLYSLQSPSIIPPDAGSFIYIYFENPNDRLYSMFENPNHKLQHVWSEAYFQLNGLTLSMFFQGMNDDSRVKVICAALYLRWLHIGTYSGHNICVSDISFLYNKKDSQKIIESEIFGSVSFRLCCSFVTICKSFQVMVEQIHLHKES